MIWEQDGHFTHSPSGTRLLSAGGSMGFFGFLNQDIQLWRLQPQTPNTKLQRTHPRSPLEFEVWSWELSRNVVSGPLSHRAQLPLQIRSRVVSPRQVEV